MKLSLTLCLAGVVALAGFLAAQDAANDEEDETRRPERRGPRDPDDETGTRTGLGRLRREEQEETLRVSIDGDDADDGAGHRREHSRPHSNERRGHTEAVETHGRPDFDHIAMVKLSHELSESLLAKLDRRFRNRYRMNVKGRTLELQTDGETLDEMVEFLNGVEGLRVEEGSSLRRHSRAFRDDESAGVIEHANSHRIAQHEHGDVVEVRRGWPVTRGMLQHEERHNRIAELEHAAAECARRLRQLRDRNEDNPELKKELRAELHELLQEAFERRLDQQRVQLHAMRKQVEAISQRLKVRQQLGDRIIERRAEELLNGPGALNWSSEASGFDARVGDSVGREQSIRRRTVRRPVGGQFITETVEELMIEEPAARDEDLQPDEAEAVHDERVLEVTIGGVPDDADLETEELLGIDELRRGREAGAESLERRVLDARFMERQHSVAVEEAEDSGDKRAIRNARLEYEHARKLLQLAELQFESRVRHLERVIEQLNEQRQAAEKGLRAVQAMYEAGEIEANAVRKAELQYREVELNLQDAESERELLEDAARLIEGQEPGAGNGPVEALERTSEPESDEAEGTEVPEVGGEPDENAEITTTELPEVGAAPDDAGEDEEG